MKIMFASDLHGSAYYCRKMLEIYQKEKADRLWILGDLLYHGPRNDLPKEYDPKTVIHLLNEVREELCVVRGNCDAEVDQMVLKFPIMADYAMIVADNLNIFATHGHIYHEGNLLPMKEGDILIHGHTHLLEAKKTNGIFILNPGSVAIPKGGNPSTYAILENKIFTIFDLEGNEVKKIQLF